MDGETIVDQRSIITSARSRRVLVSTLLVMLPAVLLAGAWRLGGVSALEDDLIYYLPVRHYIGEQIRAGNIPLWNPLTCMGSSIAADPQSGLWYPPTYLFVILPPLLAYPLTIIMHFALAGGGMYRWLRACRHDWRAALLGAIAFEFCGYLVAHRAHLTIHHAAAWLPWIFLGWQRFADKGKWQYFVLASMCLGMQMLVQHIQITIITCSLLFGYVAVVLWPCRRALWWQFPLGMIIGVMISAVQLVPTWFHFAESGRGVPAYYLFVENSWVPTSAMMFLFPMLFGSRTPNFWSEPWWGISHFCEQSAYGSILILLLALASFVLIRRSRTAAFWWGASLVAMTLALGEFTPFYKWLFHVPIYRNLRVPARWILVWSVAMPVLASMFMSMALREEMIERIKLGLRVAYRGILLFAALCLGIMFVAHLNVDRLAEAYPSEYARPIWDGLRSAIRINNPAIFWPLILIFLTGFMVSYWIRTRRKYAFICLYVICLIDLASVAVFVDVDTQTYSRSDILNPPPLATTIKELNPRPGDRLLVPRYSASYERPIEILWPQTNLPHGIATFNGYGPFWSVANRMLF